MATRYIDLTGKRFGRFYVTGDSGQRSAKQVIWSCICDCGELREVLGSNLRRGLSKSCGCLQSAITKARHAAKRLPPLEIKAKKRAADLAYRLKNRERIREYHKKHQAERSQQIVRRVKVWRAKNRERHLAQMRRYRADPTNRDKMLQLNRAWAKKHPEKRAERQRRRSARKRSQLCDCCSSKDLLPLYVEARARGMHVDHVTALANGGLHCRKNMQLLPPIENIKKGARLNASP